MPKDVKTVGGVAVISRETGWPAEERDHAFFRLVEMLPDAVIAHRDGRIIYCNQAAVRQFRARSEADLIGIEAISLAHPDHAEAILERRKLTASQGDMVSTLSGRHVRLDGTVFRSETEFLTLKLGNDVTYVIIFHDVTARVEGERALRESEGWLNAVIANTAEGIVTIGDDGKIRSFNQAAERLFGYRASEVEGANVAILLPPDERQAHDGYLAQSELHAPRIINRARDLHGMRKDGTVFPMELNVSPMSLEGGRMFVGILRDITAREETEGALKRSEERFRDFAAAAADRFWETGDTHLYRMLSPPVGRLRAPADMFLGRCPWEVDRRAMVGGDWREIKNFMENREPFRDFRYRNSMGESVLHVRMSGSPMFDENGTFKGYRGTFIDETAAVEATEQAATIQQRFHDAIDHLTEAISLWDADNRFVACNDGYRMNAPEIVRDILIPGTTFETFLRKQAESGTVPDAAGRVEDWIGEQLALMDEGSFEIHGQTRWFHVSRHRLKDGGLIEFTADVTELKRTEEALRDKSRLAELLHKTAEAANRAGSVEEAFQSCIDEVCVHTGWPVGHAYFCDMGQPAELKSAKIWHLADPRKYAAFRARSEELAFKIGEGRVGQVFESGVPMWRSNLPDDKGLPRSLVFAEAGFDGACIFPVFIGAEIVALIEFFGIDFPDRDEPLNQALSQIGTQLGRVIERDRAVRAQNRFFDAIENLEEAFVLWDANDRFVACNSRFKEDAPAKIGDMLVPGTSYETYIRARANASVIEESRGRAEEWVAERMALRGNSGFEIRRGDKWIQIRRQLLDNGLMIEFHADITAMKEREEELSRAKEAAELADRAKTRFLAAASHDLRQPLQAANLFVSALAARENDAKKTEIIDKIQSSLDAFGGLLNALLDISKLDAGMVVPEKSEFPVSGVIGRLAQEFTPLADQRGIRLKTVECDAVVYSDPVLLETILRNLLANALKYTESGKVLLGCRRRGAQLRIEVWDSGIGIPEEDIDLIFHEYFQVDNQARDRERGLGLGLSIVERLARLLGHKVDANSRLGRGSVFSIEIPVTGVIGPTQKQAAAGKFDAGGALVLVIDDDPAVLDGMELLLSGFGCHVTACGCEGDFRAEIEGIARRGDRPPDVVIADFRLPDGLTGVEAIEQVKKIFAADIPAIMLTGDISPETLIEVKEMNIPFLSKPVDLEDLQAALAAALKMG